MANVHRFPYWLRLQSFINAKIIYAFKSLILYWEFVHVSNVMNCTTDMVHHTTLALSQHRPMDLVVERLTVSMVRITKKLTFLGGGDSSPFCGAADTPVVD